MKLGFGLYYHMLNDDYFAFAKQCGASHVTVHLVDYFHQEAGNLETQVSDNQPVGGSQGWGIAGSNPHVWSYDYLVDLKYRLAKHDLVLDAVENFDPIHWYAILLDLPEKEQQIEKLTQIIKNVGKAGIPNFGYNFSIAGVSSRISKNVARGGATSVVMTDVDKTPIPKGMVWNMVYDKKMLAKGVLDQITSEQLWDRLYYFLQKLVPVAEESGVRLCAHPDDPPSEKIRLQPRLVYKPSLYIKLLNIVSSRSNALELCLGTLQEMQDETGHDIYYWVEEYVKKNSIGYIHFRNVKGKVPQYQETFIDEGDIDMRRVVGILEKYKFEGMLIPDHTPQMTCDAPWHAGMAYAMGYMKALLLEAKHK